MFTVPGWSVPSSALATQTDPRASSKAKSSEGPDGNPTLKTSVKRKRGHNQPAASAVTGDNLVELWEKVIEGKKAPSGSVGADGQNSDKPKEKRKRRTKTEGGDGIASKQTGNGTSDVTSKEKFELRKTLKQKRREKKLQLQASGDAPPERPKALPPTSPPAAASKQNAPELTPLQASMRQKLTAARFRHLNQTLYTTPSSHSVQLFQDSPEMFEEYHEGFRRQVEIWPENPVDGYVQALQTRGQSNTGHRPHKGKKDRHNSTSAPDTSAFEPLPRTNGICTVADLGCGDASLARSLNPLRKKLKLDILSYDLQAKPPHVTAADIAALPLDDGAVNLAIFCLALMGTNWLEFIDEAYRVLHWRGELWIAEIKSRFGRVAGPASSTTTRVAHSVGNRQHKSKAAAAEAEGLDHDAALAVEVDGLAGSQHQTDVSAFVAVLRRRGFALASTPEQGDRAAVDMHNKMFVTMRFIKAVAPNRGKNVPKRGEMGFVDAEERGKGGGKKTKFIDDSKGKGEEPTEEEEARVLKPCVYKLR